jgi:hypothetical protein
MPGVKGQRKRVPLNCESKKTMVCPVENCEIKRRADKLKSHFIDFVLANNEGEPVSPDSEEYMQASGEKQKHTDFYRVNNLTTSCTIKDVLSCIQNKQSLQSSVIGQLFQVSKYM